MPIDPLRISRSDPAYPPSLTRVYRPPPEIFARGDITLLTADSLLAVVGSRRGNAYGQQAIKKLLTPAVRAGVILVSGLAYGIDSMAHRLCLEEKQPTIAVLGSGLDHDSIYPRVHAGLAQRIVAGGGLLLSEYPPGTPAFLGHFPARNRIIAGLSRATLVVQAAARSGSLITARLTLDAGHDVLAVPGAITDPLAAGTNQLIQQGAAPALDAQDILDIFGLAASAASTPDRQLDADQQLLLQSLSAEPQHIDELAQRTSLPPHTVSAALIQLEMLDAAHHVGGMKYVKA